jgi:hypothetical protein
MGSDQDIDTAGTEADDESATAKQRGRLHAEGEQEANTLQRSPSGRNPKATIPDQQPGDAAPSPDAGASDTRDSGGVS